ncbi:hypothetical protein BCR34DRAFT_582005 [Clohesyomyces aquaticus]|uniref:Uncharacterized protein n=1 Tax=Clohesyomyces aquaticus TaxID=1231657 RepID=A0A1Y2ABA4_9PLEO|nr:hypothetical protein BCR34DRAFT_582005 [Clohesyomyces aquaticus]
MVTSKPFTDEDRAALERFVRYAMRKRKRHVAPRQDYPNFREARQHAKEQLNRLPSRVSWRRTTATHVSHGQNVAAAATSLVKIWGDDGYIQGWVSRSTHNPPAAEARNDVSSPAPNPPPFTSTDSMALRTKSPMPSMQAPSLQAICF